VASAVVLQLRLVLSEKFDTAVRTTPENESYVPHDSLIWAVLRYVGSAGSRSCSSEAHKVSLEMMSQGSLHDIDLKHDFTLATDNLTYHNSYVSEGEIDTRCRF
jgi:hypothetical protein